MIRVNKDKVQKALVSLAIEQSLLEVGKPLYEKVLVDLKQDYDCYLPDCYEHPEHLSEILKKLFGNANRQIIKSINKKLEALSYNQPIAKVLQVISC